MLLVFYKTKVKEGLALNCSQCLNGGSCTEYGEDKQGIVVTCPHLPSKCMVITTSE